MEVDPFTFECLCPEGFSGLVCEDEAHCPTFEPQVPWENWKTIYEVQDDFVPGGASVADNDTLWLSTGVPQGMELETGIWQGFQFLFQVRLNDSSVVNQLLIPIGNPLIRMVVSTTEDHVLFVAANIGLTNSSSFTSSNSTVLFSKVNTTALDPIFCTLINYTAYDFMVGGGIAWPFSVTALTVSSLDLLANGNLVVVVQNALSSPVPDRSLTYVVVLSWVDLSTIEVFAWPESNPIVFLAGYSLYNTSMYYSAIADVLFQARGFPPLSPTAEAAIVDVSLNATDYFGIGLFVTPYNSVYRLSIRQSDSTDLVLERLRFNVTEPSNVPNPFGILTNFTYPDVRLGFLYTTPWATTVVSQTTEPYLTLVACNCTQPNQVFFNTRCVTLCDPDPCVNGGCILNGTSLWGFTCQCTSPTQLPPFCEEA